MPLTLIYLVVGGAIGTVLRYFTNVWMYSWAGTRLPWATLTVNIIGSFILGFAMRTFEAGLATPEVRAFVTVGFCGAFTTFSTYTYETMILMQERAWVRMGLYSIGSVVVGLLAVMAGVALAGTMLRGRLA